MLQCLTIHSFKSNWNNSPKIATNVLVYNIKSPETGNVLTKKMQWLVFCCCFLIGVTKTFIKNKKTTMAVFLISIFGPKKLKEGLLTFGGLLEDLPQVTKLTSLK